MPSCGIRLEVKNGLDFFCNCVFLGRAKTHSKKGVPVKVFQYNGIIPPCTGDTCPVGPGETLIEDCQCTNYFLQTTSILQLMNNASKDIICSNSPP